MDFTNRNTLWASVLAETLVRVGVTEVVICPGSRSTPLTIALASHPRMTAIPILDERSGAFWALGAARRSHRPVAVVCTSGTAGANFFPAVIEARESGVPLLLLTADRPPELRDCAAGQAIDQLKLFGIYPVWQAELALPEPRLDLLAYLRQTLAQAAQRAIAAPGPVHLNVPLRDPLPPLPEPAVADALAQLRANWHDQEFFGHLQPVRRPITFSRLPWQEFWQGARQTERGLIVAGPAQPADPAAYCAAVGRLARSLGWPVLAEGLSPLRNFGALNQHLVAHYDLMLRNPHQREQLRPTMVLRLGGLPISKTLRLWLMETDAPQWVLDPGDRNLDPLHGRTRSIQGAIELWETPEPALPPSDYLQTWLAGDQAMEVTVKQALAEQPQRLESKIAWLLPQTLPDRTPIFICNSMPVRDVEYFWGINNREIQPFFNRGANGIDGSLSTAIGLAQHHQPAVMLTGDLALLHDTNGFLARRHFQGSLTILLINNNGGGIFEMLPVSQFEPPFEEFFATPQSVNFASLCESYGIEYRQITQWQQFCDSLSQLPAQGIRVLEFLCDRKRDAQWRQSFFRQLAV